MDGNYIKINRKILEWEWYSDINTCRLFIHMLLKANWKEGKFKGIDIPRGSFVSSISNLSEETRLTVDEVRTAIKHLKLTNEITSKSHSKFTVFTIKNYCQYQDLPKQDAKQTPSSSQAIPILFPTIEEGKEERIKDISVNACERFQEFWNIYPKKTNQTLAEQEYVQLILSGIDESVLITAATNYAEACQIQCKPDQFIKYPDNWLRDNKWIKYTSENYKRPKPPETEKPTHKKNAFTNYPQRSYDYAELEKQLLKVGERNDDD